MRTRRVIGRTIGQKTTEWHKEPAAKDGAVVYYNLLRNTRIVAYALTEKVADMIINRMNM